MSIHKTVSRQLLAVAEAYAKARKVGLWTVSADIKVAPRFFLNIKEGASSPIKTAHADHILQAFSDIWPDDAIWPDVVARPEPTRK